MRRLRSWLRADVFRFLRQAPPSPPESATPAHSGDTVPRNPLRPNAEEMVKQAKPITPRARSIRRSPAKLLISLIAFGGALLLGWGLRTAQVPAYVVGLLGVSLFVASVTFLVLHFYDIDKRFDRHAVDSEARIDESFRKISEATNLFSLVEASALKTDAVTQLVANSVRIKPNPQLIFDYAQHEVQRLSEILKTLGDAADLTYDGEDRNSLLGLTRYTRATIDAVNATSDMPGEIQFDGSLWQSDLGQRFLEAQRDAVRRNVRIRRIFILSHPKLREDAAFRYVIEMHSAIGIEVRVLDPIVFPRQFVPVISDFVLFDGVVSYQTSQAAYQSQASIASTQLVTNPSKVQRAIERFQDLWLVATPL